jgi:hypothetical protein
LNSPKKTRKKKQTVYSRLFARVPVIQTPGNHELNPEPFPLSGSKFADVESFLSRFKDYNAYWPSPQFPELTRDGPTPETLQPVGPTQSADPDSGMQNRNQFHAHTIPGIATVISLSNYILWENYGEAQLEWLKAQLASIDRSATPWLIVIWHASWYATYSKHWKETECMRRAYEPVFRQYGVDIALNGHNHGLERSKPMYAWQVDNSGCGTVHVTQGGGCADDLTFGWIDEEELMPYLPLKPSTCPADPLKDKVCPHTYCSDPSKFNIPGYQVSARERKKGLAEEAGRVRDPAEFFFARARASPASPQRSLPASALVHLKHTAPNAFQNEVPKGARLRVAKPRVSRTALPGRRNSAGLFRVPRSHVRHQLPRASVSHQSALFVLRQQPQQERPQVGDRLGHPHAHPRPLLSPARAATLRKTSRFKRPLVQRMELSTQRRPIKTIKKECAKENATRRCRGPKGRVCVRPLPTERP